MNKVRQTAISLVSGITLAAGTFGANQVASPEHQPPPKAAHSTEASHEAGMAAYAVLAGMASFAVFYGIGFVGGLGRELDNLKLQKTELQQFTAEMRDTQL
jgi:hypothetical protein